MKKVMIKHCGLIFCSLTSLYTNSLRAEVTTTEKLAISSKITNLLSKKELIEYLQDHIDLLLEDDKRNHPFTMAVIHFLNLLAPKPQSSPRPPGSSKFTDAPLLDQEKAEHMQELTETMKALTLAILAQHADLLDKELNELIEQLKN